MPQPSHDALFHRVLRCAQKAWRVPVFFGWALDFVGTHRWSKEKLPLTCLQPHKAWQWEMDFCSCEFILAHPLKGVPARINTISSINGICVSKNGPVSQSAMSYPFRRGVAVTAYGSMGCALRLSAHLTGSRIWESTERPFLAQLQAPVHGGNCCA